MQMSLSHWVKQSILDQIDWMLQQCLFIRWREGSEGQAMVFIYFWNQRGKPWYFYISETRGTSHGQIDWMLQQCLFIRWREREERTCKKRPWATFTRHCSFLSAQSQKSKKMLPKVRLWKCCHVSKLLETEILLGKPTRNGRFWIPNLRRLNIL